MPEFRKLIQSKIFKRFLTWVFLDNLSVIESSSTASGFCKLDNDNGEVDVD